MAARKPGRTTIAVMQDVRDNLKHIGRKDQDYNDILKNLIELFENQSKKEGVP
jgi:hypothetical protein